MASKRLIGVLTVKDGRLVKSYGYQSWRPAGRLSTALRNLDRWAADEIVVLDISRRAGLDGRVLDQIAAAGIATPLAYGGGIRSVDDLARLMDLGCDRFVVESLLFDDPATVAVLADFAGRQALIGSIPLVGTPDGWAFWRPAPGRGIALPSGGPAALQAFLGGLSVSEYLVTAVVAEGQEGGFPAALPESLRGLPVASVIWFGGLDTPTAAACLREPATAAVAFGNPLHESELALPHLRAELRSLAGEAGLRPVRLLAS
jgi:cyclase